MCEHASNPGGREAAMVEAHPGVYCDPCIAPLVEALNEAGISTVASCCGHGERPGKIALADGRELFILPGFDSARQYEEQSIALERLEKAGEKLAVEARHRLCDITGDDPDHRAWNGAQAEALTAWNEARNSLRPDVSQQDQPEVAIEQGGDADARTTGLGVDEESGAGVAIEGDPGPECETCEDEGQVCKNFGIDSPGRPEIVPCPDCSTQQSTTGKAMSCGRCGKGNNGVNAYGVLMCECKPFGAPHAYEPGEWCSPEHVEPTGQRCPNCGTGKKRGEQ